MSRDIKSYKKINLISKTFITRISSDKSTTQRSFIYQNFKNSKASTSIANKFGSSSLDYAQTSKYLIYNHNKSQNILKSNIKNLQYGKAIV